MSLPTSLANQLLVAMPSMTDPNFTHTVIYVCEHHSQGAIGLIINRPMQYPLSLIFEQMKIEPIRLEQNKKPLLFGGPIQPERGFVIHKERGLWHSSLSLREDVIVTTSNDIIRAIAEDTGPKEALVTLGYTAWLENQLEQEVMNNAWLVCPYNTKLLYEIPYADRWMAAGHLLGINMNQLTSFAGHS